MKYWEIIANRLSKAGWSLGWVSVIDFEGRTSGLLMVPEQPASHVFLGYYRGNGFWGTLRPTRSENSEPMKKYILSLLGIFVAMAFIASGQQEGTTVTEEPNSAPPGVHESSRAVTDTLAQETRVDFGLRENVRADEKLTAFVELESAIRCV